MRRRAIAVITSLATIRDLSWCGARSFVTNSVMASKAFGRLADGTCIAMTDLKYVWTVPDPAFLRATLGSTERVVVAIGAGMN